MHLHQSKKNDFSIKDGPARDTEKVVIGSIMSSRYKNNGVVVCLTVMPSFRGNGLGEMLLQRSIDQMKEYGLDNCVLQTQRNNTNAINLYEKVGFELKGILKRHYHTNTNQRIDGVELKKSLN